VAQILRIGIIIIIPRVLAFFYSFGDVSYGFILNGEENNYHHEQFKSFGEILVYFLFLIKNV